MANIIVIFFVLNEKKFSSHMYQISEHINYSNHKNYSYDKMRKMIVNLGSKKCKNYNNYIYKLSCLHNLLLTSIKFSDQCIKITNNKERLNELKGITKMKNMESPFKYK